MTTRIGAPWRYLESVDSTNEAAADWARGGAPHGAIVQADMQTAGKGRRGRTWSSPAGKGLYLSIILRPADDTAAVARLTMLAALAAARAAEEQTGFIANTKWPNDILLHDRKIGGVLCEADFTGGALQFVIVGLGLNVNFSRDELPARPLFPASSLLIETGQVLALPEVAKCVVREFDALYGRYSNGEWNELCREFERRCVGLEKHVTVRLESEEFSGQAARIDNDGALVVLTAAGERRVVAGDVGFN